MSFCCKGGKAAVLRPTPRFATAPGSGTSNAHVFLDTLAGNVAPTARLLQMPDPLPMGGGGGGGRGPVAAAVVLPAGGLRVAWKHDAADVALPPDQLAGEQGWEGWAEPAGMPHLRCTHALCMLPAAIAAAELQLIGLSAHVGVPYCLAHPAHRPNSPHLSPRAQAAGGGGAALH